jgi:hypothetical protein
MIYKALNLIYYLLGLINNLINNGENVRHLPQNLNSLVTMRPSVEHILLVSGEASPGELIRS